MMIKSASICILAALVCTVLCVDENNKCKPNDCHTKFKNEDCPAGSYFLKSEDCDLFNKREICCEYKDDKQCRETECHSKVSGSYCGPDEFEKLSEDCGFLKIKQTCCRSK